MNDDDIEVSYAIKMGEDDKTCTIEMHSPRHTISQAVLIAGLRCLADEVENDAKFSEVYEGSH